MKNVYLAAPLFTPLEREFNLRIARILEERFKVFLPQRDGVLIPGRSISREEFLELSKNAFLSDTGAIAASDFVVAILDGRTIDEGVAFELGFARALGKTCVGLRSDTRVLLPQGINPMIESSVSLMLYSEQGLVEWASGESGFGG